MSLKIASQRQCKPTSSTPFAINSVPVVVLPVKNIENVLTHVHQSADRSADPPSLSVTWRSCAFVCVSCIRPLLVFVPVRKTDGGLLHERGRCSGDAVRDGAELILFERSSHLGRQHGEGVRHGQVGTNVDGVRLRFVFLFFQPTLRGVQLGTIMKPLEKKLLPQLIVTRKQET